MNDEELRQKVWDVCPRGLLSGDVDAIMQLIKQDRQNTIKAFGGCTNCYGKGYSTRQAYANGRVAIPLNPMVYCECDRGKQLKQLTTNSEAKDE